METTRRKRAIVLLVDDDPGDQELTRRALQGRIFKTDLRIVSDGEAGLDYLYQRGSFTVENAPRPDLVLLDLNMPKLDGRHVLATIRADAKLSPIPVVVLTTSQHDEDIARSYDLGCNSFITKPVEIDSFIKAIKELDQYWFELVTLPGGVMV